MDDMLKMYIEKRREYESKIKKDLLDIEKSVTRFVEVDDYFSIKDKEELITFKIINYALFKNGLFARSKSSVDWRSWPG